MDMDMDEQEAERRVIAWFCRVFDVAAETVVVIGIHRGWLGWEIRLEDPDGTYIVQIEDDGSITLNP